MIGFSKTLSFGPSELVSFDSRNSVRFFGGLFGLHTKTSVTPGSLISNAIQVMKITKSKNYIPSCFQCVPESKKKL